MWLKSSPKGHKLFIRNVKFQPVHYSANYTSKGFELRQERFSPETKVSRKSQDREKHDCEAKLFNCQKGSKSLRCETKKVTIFTIKSETLSKTFFKGKITWLKTFAIQKELQILMKHIQMLF